MNHYMKLVQGELTDIPGKIPNSTIPALKRLSLGLFYLVGYTLLSPTSQKTISSLKTMTTTPSGSAACTC